MEADDRGARGLGEQDGPGLGHKARAARTIDGKDRVLSLALTANHFHQGLLAATGTGTSCRAVAMLLEDARNVLPVEVLTGHGHDAALSPEPGAGKDFAVPAGVNQSLAAPASRFPIPPAEDFPAQTPADQKHCEIPDPTREEYLDALPVCKGAWLAAKGGPGFLRRGRLARLEPR